MPAHPARTRRQTAAAGMRTIFMRGLLGLDGGCTGYCRERRERFQTRPSARMRREARCAAWTKGRPRLDSTGEPAPRRKEGPGIVPNAGANARLEAPDKPVREPILS